MLYLCPTPIGNLEDITIRVLNTLKKVDLIACEDTRVTQKLLNFYNIESSTTSLHKYNMNSKMEYIISLLSNGKSIAYVSDAGMPGISDPGVELIRECQKHEFSYTVLPGPSASITGLVMSGLDNKKFTFVGFLDQKNLERKKELEKLKTNEETMIFYESPHRIYKTLEDMYETFGDRKVSVIREISKIYEEVTTGYLKDILKNKGIKEKGEILVVVSGAEIEEDQVDIERVLKEQLSLGNSRSQSVKNVVKKYNLSRNEVYKISLDL